MSNFASKYNKSISKFTWTPDTEKPVFRALKDLYAEGGENRIPVLGVYVNHKSKYGDAPVIVSNPYFVNLPKHLTDTVEQMLLDEDFIDAVNRGRVFADIYQYETNGKTCYSVNWVDVD